MKAMTEILGMLFGHPRNRKSDGSSDDGLTTRTISTTSDGAQSVMAICKNGVPVQLVDVGHISALPGMQER